MNSILAELRRRNVFRVAAGYLVAGWIVMQVVATIGGAAGLPEWTDSLVLVLLIGAAPIVFFIAWAFELTPDGMKKTEASDEPVGFRPFGPSDYLLLAGVIVVLGVAGIQALMPTEFSGHDNATAAESAQGASLPGMAAASDNSIAVLPFSDLSPEGDQEYFGDGIAEEILNVLARIDALEVSSRTSAFAFKEQRELSIRDIAASLQVRYVLEGSVRMSGNTVRITAQLIDAPADNHLWSDTFDRHLTVENIFAIQDEISAAIITALTDELGIEIAVPDNPTEVAGTEAVDAYTAYLQGRENFLNRNYTNIVRAVEFFERAVELDPTYADAWGGLAMAYSVSPGWAFFDRDYRMLAIEAAERALTLEPANSWAFSALAQSQYISHPPNWEDAIRYFELAIEADPYNATALFWHGQMMQDLGYFDETERLVSQCLEIDSDYSLCLHEFASNAIIQGRYDEGLRRLDALISTDLEESYPIFLAEAVSRGDTLIAAFMIREMADSIPVEARWIVQEMLRALSDEDYDREAALARFERRLRDAGYDPASDPYREATHLLAFGAYDRISTQFAPTWWWAPAYPGLRDSGAYKRAIRDLGIDDYWRGHGFPPQCRPVGDDDFECD